VGKTFWQVTRVEPGMQADHVLIAHMALGNRYTNATAAAFFDAVIARVRQHPSTRSAAWVQGAPMSHSGGGVVEFQSSQPGKPPKRYRLASVDPEYFETVGAQLVAGRFLTAQDRNGAPPVAVVSEGFSARWLDGAPAVGRMIPNYKCRRNNDCDPFDITIVGVVKEMVQEASDKEPYPLVFRPMAQRQFIVNAGSLLVRTSGELAPLQAIIRDEVRRLDPQQPEPGFFSLERVMEERIAPRKFTLVLLASFAGLAVGLAIIGLYSVLAYLVAERTREIGIRIAIGADAGRVTAMVLGQGLPLTIIGLVIGAAVSVAAVRVLRAWMYEMSVYDAPTFVAVSLLLGIVALVASWLPARRASRVDPVQALRAD